MAGVEIKVTIEGAASLADQLMAELDDGGTELRVKHEPGACGPCRGNEDPRLVPFPGCNGNIAAKDPDDAKALAKGNLCRCTVVLVHVRDGYEEEL